MYSDKVIYHRPSSEIEAQLAEVKALMASDAPAESGKAAWFQARAAANQLASLEDELSESINAELANADLTLALDGAPVKDHRIRADFLGTMLTKAQGLVNALAAAIERPDVRNTAPDAKEENWLFVGPSFASSYGVRFSMLKSEDLGHIRISNEDEVLKALTTLLDPSSPPEQVDALISKTPRVRSNYRDLVETIASSGAKIVARTHSLRSGVRMSADQAYYRAQRLKGETAQSVMLPPMKGFLVGGDTLTTTFHFKAGKKDFHGKIAEGALKAFVRLCFGPMVTVHLKQLPKVAADGAQAGRTDYELVKVTKVRVPRQKK
jgi:hypothetical protein